MKFKPFFIVLIFAAGCAPYEQIQDVIYLQDAEVRTPIIQMPVFVNTNDLNDKTLVVTPRFFFGNSEEFEDNIGQYYFQTPGSRNTSNNSNYHLESTNLNIGIDADLFFSNSFGLSGGYNLSNIDNQNFSGGHAGIVLKSFENTTGIRLDAGAAWQEGVYDVQSVVVRTQKEWFGDTETLIFYTRDKGRQTNWSFYLNLNLTYDDPQAIIGGFFNLGYIQQKILDIVPSNSDQEYDYLWDYGTYNKTDLRNEISVGFFSLNGGLLATMIPGIKIMGGVKYYIELSNDKKMDNILTPFIQLQFGI